MAFQTYKPQASSIPRQDEATEKYVASLLSAAPSRPRKTDVASFLNTLTDSLAKIQRSGVKAISERRETDAQIVLTIIIPKG